MKDMFEKMNVSKAVLSRTLEDSSTMVLPLIPWAHLVYIMHNNLMFQSISSLYGQSHVTYVPSLQFMA